MPNNPYEERTVAVPSRVGVSRLSDGSVTTSTTYTTGSPVFFDASPGPISPPPIRNDYYEHGGYAIPSPTVAWDQPVMAATRDEGRNAYGHTSYAMPSSEPPADFENATIYAPVTGEYTFYANTHPSYTMHFNEGAAINRAPGEGVSLASPSTDRRILILTGTNTFTSEGQVLFAPTATTTLPASAITENMVTELKAKVEEQANQIQFLIDTLHEKGLLV